MYCEETTQVSTRQVSNRSHHVLSTKTVGQKEVLSSSLLGLGIDKD